MNWLGLADRLAPTGPGIQVRPGCCVHSLNSASTCDICVRRCPFDALHLSPTISLENKRCTACGVCLHVCPVEAFSGEDGVSETLNVAARFETAKTLELVCQRHPTPERGPTTSEIVLKTGGCLAGLGPSAYVGLAALGYHSVQARLDACVACPLGPARREIELSLAAAQALLGDGYTLAGIDTHATATWTQRTVYSVKSPPVSRRDLFRVFTAEAPRAAVRALLPVEHETSDVKQPPRERRRLINALRRLINLPPTPSLPGKGLEETPDLTPPALLLCAQDKLFPSREGGAVSPPFLGEGSGEGFDPAREGGAISPPFLGEGSGERSVSGLPSLPRGGVGGEVDFVQLQVSEACTASGVCGRVCPTAALQFEQTATQHFRLTFLSAACTDCGVCLDLCEAQALSRGASLTPSQAIQPKRVTLREGQTRTCAKCGARFAGVENAELCPVCDFRKRNPFGSRLPTGWSRPLNRVTRKAP